MRRITTVLNQMWRKFLPDSKMILVVTILSVSVLLISTTRFSKDITIVDNGKTIKVSTNRAKVGDALRGEDIKIGEKDKVLPQIGEVVTKDMTITIKRAVPVTIEVDGKKLQVLSAEEAVGDMLRVEGIVLNEKDKIFPKVTDGISESLVVKITRIEEKLLTSTENIPFRIVSKQDSNLAKGIQKVISEGTEGQKEVTTKVVYEDGKEVYREVIGEVIKKKAVDKVVAVGSLGWLSASRSGNKIFYTKKLRMKGTSYTSNFHCTGKNPGDKGFGITATGTKAKRIKNGYSTVAVDPDVIPLGTKLYIEGYGYGIAEDVGGGVNGSIIDLYFEPGEEFRSWFAHYVNVYIIK